MTCFCLDTHICFITQGKNPSDLLKTRMLKITRQICQRGRWWCGTWRPTTWHDPLPSLLNTKSYGKTRQEQAPHACQITSTSQLNATLHHAPLDFFSEWRASSPILFPFPSLCQQSHTAMYNTSVGGCQTVQANRLVLGHLKQVLDKGWTNKSSWGLWAMCQNTNVDTYLCSLDSCWQSHWPTMTTAGSLIVFEKTPWPWFTLASITFTMIITPWQQTQK